MFRWIWLMAGCLSLLYFTGIALYTGLGNKFTYFWLLLALLCFVFHFIWRRGLLAKLPPGICKVTGVILLMGVAFFVFVQICIMSRYTSHCKERVDYLVVLGAQMKTSGPSRALKYRLDAAYDYLQQYEDTVVIVSGGRGKDEPVSEAQGMKAYLVAKGIPAERIILEDRSVNTYENLQLSAQLLRPEQDKVAVVTNNFHLFRAMKIAEKAGYEKLYGVAAQSELALLPHNTMREFFGIMKDFLVGNL